ncbi:MAG TPA: hypothetical protein VK971_09520, partial [Thiohalobacter sp.]|nr:hypothetical protein [Thiohalobacter sp.]
APRAEFARIFAFLGLAYRPWHSRRVVASSVGKRQPPAIEPAVRTQCDALLTRFHALLPAASGEST